MIAAAIAGAWLGASTVAAWTRRRVQIGMGAALLVAAALLARQLAHGPPNGADAVSLDGPRLAVGVAGNVVLGALMTLGVGLYAPRMILVSLLGMNAKAAFPIMMGSCAFLMPVAGVRFVAKRAYAPRVALGLTLGGIPAVLVAAFVVHSARWAAPRAILSRAAVARVAAPEAAPCPCRRVSASKPSPAPRARSTPTAGRPRSAPWAPARSSRARA